MVTWCGCKVANALTGYSGEAEVLTNVGQCRGVIAQVGAVCSVEGVLMVGAPLRLSETCITARDDPVHDGMAEGVHGGMSVDVS